MKDEEYTTIGFNLWNKLHYCVAFCPILIVGIAVALSLYML